MNVTECTVCGFINHDHNAVHGKIVLIVFTSIEELEKKTIYDDTHLCYL